MLDEKGLSLLNPQISVIIPMYNCEGYVAECMQSLQRQTLKNIEIICIDDGSTDDTLKIVESFAKSDRRIRILTQENKGSGPARNYGMSYAKGEYIAFLDADDFYPFHHTLMKMYECAKQNKAVICGGSLYQLVNGELVTDPSKFDSKYTFDKDGFVTYFDYQFDYGYWRFIYERDFLLKNDLSFPDYLRGQDPPFFVRVMSLAEKFYALAEPTYVYRISHKKVNWTIRRLTDAYKSDADILKLSRQYGLHQLHIRIAQRLSWTSLIPFVEKYRKEMALPVLMAIDQIDYSIINNAKVNIKFPAIYEEFLAARSLKEQKVIVDSNLKNKKIENINNVSKRRGAPSELEICFMGIPIFRNSRTDFQSSMMLLGIPLFWKYKDKFKSKLNVLGLPIYSRTRKDFKVRTRILFVRYSHKDNFARLLSAIENQARVINDLKKKSQISENNISTVLSLIQEGLKKNNEEIKLAVQQSSFIEEKMLSLNQKMDDNQLMLSRWTDNQRDLFFGIDSALSNLTQSLSDAHESTLESTNLLSDNQSMLGCRIEDLQKLSLSMNDNLSKTHQESLITSQKLTQITRDEQKVSKEVLDSLQKISQNLGQVDKQIVANNRLANEIAYAEIFKSTIEDSIWMSNKTFSPGRWAIGYQVLYILYRVLNEVRPKSILELGLGQSTRMVAQYVEASPEVYHRVVEHDSSWIDFFSKQYALSPRSQIVQLDWDFINYNGAANVRCYRDFSAQFNDQRFDLILIDGPLGGDMRDFSRVDVLRMMPNCLSENFVILLDDAERVGEINTLREMEKSLKLANVEYSKGYYRGSKDLVVLAAKHLSFVTSM